MRSPAVCMRPRKASLQNKFEKVSEGGLEPSSRGFFPRVVKSPAACSSAAKTGEMSPSSVPERRPSSQGGPGRRDGGDVGMIRIVPGRRPEEPATWATTIKPPPPVTRCHRCSRRAEPSVGAIQADNSSIVRCRIANSVHQMHEASGRILAWATPLCCTRSAVRTVYCVRRGQCRRRSDWLVRETRSMSTTPLFHVVDAVTIPVPDLDAGLCFYRDSLGHQLRWRHDDIG